MDIPRSLQATKRHFPQKIALKKINLEVILFRYYLYPMIKKLIIGGEEATIPYNLRTTEFILDAFRREAFLKNTSINVLVNKLMYAKAIKLNEKNNKP